MSHIPYGRAVDSGSERLSVCVAKLVLLVVALLGLCVPASAAPGCHVREHREFRRTIEPGHQYVAVSVREKDITVSALLCLLRALREPLSKTTRLTAMVFDDENAAIHFHPGPGTGWEPDAPPPDVTPQYFRHARAFYVFAPELVGPTSAGGESFWVLMSGWSPGTRGDNAIDFRTAHPFRCRYELGSRCVLKMDTPM